MNTTFNLANMQGHQTTNVDITGMVEFRNSNIVVLLKNRLFMADLYPNITLNAYISFGVDVGSMDRVTWNVNGLFF